MFAMTVRSGTDIAPHTGAVELDERTDNAPLAQQVRDAQHEVGRGTSLGQTTVEAHDHDLRHAQHDPLPEHRSERLDPADAPGEHTEPVHHGGVRVGADQCVGRQQITVESDDLCEMLDVDLVHDACAGGDDGDALEGAPCPLEKSVALRVPSILDSDVAFHRVRTAEDVDGQ
jgi:hypothetical protein